MSETFSGVSGAMTSIASFLAEKDGGVTLCEHLGRQTVWQWRNPEQEFFSMLGSAAVFDLGYRCLLQVTGGDQVRWLNGMITNTVKDLEPGHSNYSFVLTAQGRILGDVTAYRCSKNSLRSDHILLATDELQAEALSAHFDHFIIMDDVELKRVEGMTALGIAGPEVRGRMAAAGLVTPESESGFVEADFEGHRVMVSQEYSPVTERFAVWLPEAAAPLLWEKLCAVGAKPAGVAALEMLRVVEAIPQYGVDFGEKHLPQEVDAVRPLHFKKGCYLGQEIVERIRSRATVHRQLRLLELDGAVAELPAEVISEGQSVGEITSVAELNLADERRTLALGMVRNEPVARHLPLTCGTTTVKVLDAEEGTSLRKALQDDSSQEAAAH